MQVYIDLGSFKQFMKHEYPYFCNNHWGNKLVRLQTVLCLEEAIKTRIHLNIFFFFEILSGAASRNTLVWSSHCKTRKGIIYIQFNIDFVSLISNTPFVISLFNRKIKQSTFVHSNCPCLKWA